MKVKPPNCLISTRNICALLNNTKHLLQIGSTEWVEENREILTSRAVAYLNVDVAVGGPGFQASATPQLDALLIEASKMVIKFLYLKI